MVAQVLISKQAVFSVSERAGEIHQRPDDDRVGVWQGAQCADRLDEILPLNQDATDAGPLGRRS
jgi:hypothetical protein